MEALAVEEAEDGGVGGGFHGEARREAEGVRERQHRRRVLLQRLEVVHVRGRADQLPHLAREGQPSQVWGMAEACAWQGAGECFPSLQRKVRSAEPGEFARAS